MEGVKFYRNAVDVVYFQRDGGRLYWTLERTAWFTLSQFSTEDANIAVIDLIQITFEEFVDSIRFDSLIDFYGIIADETGVDHG